MPTSATRADSMRQHWASVPAEERRRGTAPARREHAVREIVRQWPELSESQQQRCAPCSVRCPKAVAAMATDGKRSGPADSASETAPEDLSETQQDHTALGRFETAAPYYVAAGWPVLPIRSGKDGDKGTPPTGTTGWDGVDLTAEQVEHQRKINSTWNIGIRCPVGVVGLDFDCYDGKPGEARRKAWEAAWGPLPDTYVSTSRTDGVSGIRWFKVPEDWIGIESVPGVDVIQRHHRWGLVAPSKHPTTENTYRWEAQSPDLPAMLEAGHFTVPIVYDLPELPKKYQDGLKFTGQRHQNGKVPTNSDDLDKLQTEGNPCSHVLRALDKYATLTGQGNPCHDAMTKTQMDLLRKGEQEHPGVRVALADEYASFEQDRGDVRDVVSEWDRALHTGAAKILAAPTPANKRGCADTARRSTIKSADDRFTDARMAETVAEEVLADRYIWCEALDWLTWDGTRWVGCSDVSVGEAVRAWTLQRFAGAVRDLQTGQGDQEALDGWRSMLQGHKESTVLKLARGIVEHEAIQFDADPDLINTPGGVVDPRTLETTAHDPALLMTRITSGSYRPGFTHPDWEQAQEALPEDERAWFKTRIGQAMTGHRTPDGVLPVLWGSGENGKSLMTTDGAVPALGDYASMASAKLFKAGSEHSEEMASLRGKRLVVAEELAEGRSLDVAALKRVQDVGLVTARHVYGRNMTFKASHSLMTTANTLPVINETDHGTWRRLDVLRFRFTFRKAHEPLLTENDRRGDERLKARIESNETGQHDAIVTWAIEGAHNWYVNGPLALAPTERIEADTLAWRVEADRVLGYWQECLIPDRDAMVITTEMRDHFNTWLRTNGHNDWPKELFGPRFVQHNETAKNGVDQARTASRDGLCHPPGVVYGGQLPKQLVVYRGVRFRTENDD